MLDCSFADPGIVDQRVPLTEILEKRIEDDVIALGAVPLANLLHAEMKNDRACQEGDVGDENTRLSACGRQPERRSKQRHAGDRRERRQALPLLDVLDVAIDLHCAGTGARHGRASRVLGVHGQSDHRP